MVTRDTDAYLEIAQAVLRRARMPMSTHQIMKSAYLSGMVPDHLHGRTQHKTLGARLSEDILFFRRRSRFFRTQPGRFFLREFIKDRSLPLAYRTPIVARRRRRSLQKSNIACFSERYILDTIKLQSKSYIDPEEFTDLIHADLIQYCHLDDVKERGLAPIYAYAMVYRGRDMLLHSKSRYAEARSTFAERLMNGFPIPLCHDDMTLFDMDDHGLANAGLTAVAIDLDLEFSAEFPHFEQSAKVTGLLPILDRDGHISLIGLVSLEAPSHFEPLGRRLAVGDLEWFDPKTQRHKIYDFDPWSRVIWREFPHLIAPAE